jgi:RNA polymerase sigma factor (TIGR02999 family)
MASPGEITVILQRWDEDRQAAVERLTPIVYSELRKIAAGYLRQQRPGHTLSPTGLVHEAYVRLVEQERAGLRDRSHFYALAARIMRQILADLARARSAAKRDAGIRVTWSEQLEPNTARAAADFMAIHQALDQLEGRNARAAQVIELRYFGGLQLSEIAEAVSASLATVKRDLALAEAWLGRALAGS